MDGEGSISDAMLAQGAVNQGAALGASASAADSGAAGGGKGSDGATRDSQGVAPGSQQAAAGRTPVFQGKPGALPQHGSPAGSRNRSPDPLHRLRRSTTDGDSPHSLDGEGRLPSSSVELSFNNRGGAGGGFGHPDSRRGTDASDHTQPLLHHHSVDGAALELSCGTGYSPAAGVAAEGQQGAGAATDTTNPLFFTPPVGQAPSLPPPYRTISDADALAALQAVQPGRPQRGPSATVSPRASGDAVSIQHCTAGGVQLLPAATAAAAVKEEQWKELQNLSAGAGQGRLSGDAGGGAGGDFDDSDEGKAHDHHDDIDFDDEAEDAKRPWYQRRRFWRLAIPLFIFIFFTGLGVGFVVLGGQEDINISGSEFQVWRLCFFIAGLPVIWWMGKWVMTAVVYGVERTMFTWRNALYFAWSVRRPMTNVIRAAAALGWWAAIMTIGNDNINSTLSTAYTVILKIWACVTLFMTANLLKTLLAKLMSSKFNKHSHLQKMHDSLRKEHILHVLLQPRPKPQPPAVTAAGDVGELPEGHPVDSEDPAASNLPSRHNTEGGLGISSAGGAGGQHKLEHRTVSEGGKRTAASKSFKNMLSFLKLKSNKRPSTIPEDELPPAEAAGDTLTPSHTPGHVTPTHQQQQQQPGPLHSVISIDVVGTPRRKGSLASGGGGGGLATPPHSPLSARAPLGSPGAKGPLLSSRAGSEVSGYTAASTGRAGRRGARLTRQQGLRRASDGLQPLTKQSDKPEDMQAAALASVPSTSSRSDQEVLAEKLVKMERYIRKNHIQVTFKDELTRTERCESVTNEMEAKKLAFYLFWNVKGSHDSRELEMSDLLDFLSPKDAERAFDMLDDDKDGSITLQDCCAAVVGIFKERSNLAASLKDTKTVVGKLETLIGIMLHVIFVFFYLAIFGVDVMQAYLAFSSLILAFSFVFSSSLRVIYENVVFLFVVHAYDIGDTLIIGGDSYKVDEINIQFTTLVNGSNARVFYPNQQLMNHPFANQTISGNKGESFKVLVDLDTPGTVLDAVKAAAEAHIKAEASEFDGTLGVSFSASTNPMKMALSVYYEFSHNGVDGGRCTRARNKLYVLLAETLTQLGVRYTWPEVRERYMVGPPGSAAAALAEAVLAAKAAGETGEDAASDGDPKMKLL